MIPTAKILGKTADAFKVMSRSGVFNDFTLATGIFDLLHRGHVEMLHRARRAGHGPLIVGINDDYSVRILKGKKRPVCPLEDRLYMLAQLSCVDGVFWFDGPTVDWVLNYLKPKWWCKGGDYTLKTLNRAEVRAAKDVGTKIVIVPRQGNWSTTGLLKRL